MMPHVTQHELFIRAAMEGRRDHVYQAAMFDPLTAATMPMDKIVEMCDELIAAHGFEKDGGFLPNLDARKTLVPTSGKTFAPPTPQELRASWDAAQRSGRDEAILEWKVMGPFSFGDGATVTTAFAPVDEASLAAGTLSGDWKTAIASRKGFVSLSSTLGGDMHTLGYAFAEIESVHSRETVVKYMADDGIKVWLNGKLVHEKDVLTRHEGEFPVYLNSGTNRLLIKVTRADGDWGYAVSVPQANF